MITRREFGKLAVAGVVVARPEGRALLEATLGAMGINSTVNGVHLGVQTYSFRDLPRPAGAADSVDVVIDAMKFCGIGECELFSPRAAVLVGRPRRARRGADTRLQTRETSQMADRGSLDHFRNVRKKFMKPASRSPHAKEHISDAELNRGFEMTRALGARP